jgi:hypothetical protein
VASIRAAFLESEEPAHLAADHLYGPIARYRGDEVSEPDPQVRVGPARVIQQRPAGPFEHHFAREHSSSRQLVLSRLTLEIIASAAHTIFRRFPLAHLMRKAAGDRFATWPAGHHLIHIITIADGSPANPRLIKKGGQYERTDP